jgi:hypothetical protein
MAVPYPMELRIRIMTDIENGETEQDTADKFSVSRQTVQADSKPPALSLRSILQDVPDENGNSNPITNIFVTYSRKHRTQHLTKLPKNCPSTFIIPSLTTN